MEKDKPILVYYISIGNINENEIEEYMKTVMSKISSSSINEIIAIPIYGETRIECINPKYITDGELIKKHERLMSELLENLKNQVDQIK